MFLSPTSKDEVLAVILKEKTNKAPGHDDININVLKKIAPYIVQLLTYLINSCFQSGIVPNVITKVTLILKSGDTEVFSNYRPLSVLPVFSKVLEKLFYKSLIEYINMNTILFDGQYGFWEKLPTSLALVDLIKKTSLNHWMKKNIQLWF